MDAPLRAFLDRAYGLYNRRELVGRDPLRFVLRFDTPDDQEIAGLLAASLAFGRVEQIARSVTTVLDIIGSPSECVDRGSGASLARELRGFRHRFVTGKDVADLLEGMRRIRAEWGTINRYFVGHCRDPAAVGTEDLRPAISALVRGLGAARRGPSFLLPDPARGSACKRLHLYLRWMVRRDDVDPGPWKGVAASELIVPLDTHMHRICSLLGFTRRAQADGRAAREVTDAFLRIRADDPVRYDFALTRMGMLGRLDEIPAELARRGRRCSRAAGPEYTDASAIRARGRKDPWTSRAQGPRRIS